VPSLIGSENGEPKKEITLEDDEPHLVALMIDYFYQLTYNDAPRPANANKIVVKGGEIVESAAPTSVEDTQDPASPDDGLAGTNENVDRFVAMDETVTEEAGDVPANWQFDAAPVEDEHSFASPEVHKKGKKKKKNQKRLTFEGEEGAGKLEDVSTRSQLQLAAEGVDVAHSKLCTNSLMYALADKYGIDDLKEVARAKFAAPAAEDWKLKAFALSAGIVCETTPKVDKGLRRVVVEILNEYRELLDYEEIQELLDSGNGLAWEMLKTVCEQQARARDRPIEGPWSLVLTSGRRR